jgi:spore coat protein H
MNPNLLYAQPCRSCITIFLCAMTFFIASPSEAMDTSVQEPVDTKEKKEESARKREQERNAFFTIDPLTTIQIEIDAANINKLSQRTRVDVPCIVRESIPGQTEPNVYSEVIVHLKGAIGSYRGIHDKPALTLKFHKKSKGERFHGMEKIHLNNSVQDDSFMRENLGGAVYRAAGLVAPRVSVTRVSLNGRDLGLYTLIEGFDDGMMKNGFGDKDGVQYQGNFTDINPNLPNNGKDQAASRKRMQELVDAARERDPAKRRERLEQILDVDRFLTSVALDGMICHWDGYSGNRNNYRIYDDPKSGRFVFMPHGMDQIYKSSQYPLMGRGAMLSQILLETREDREKYFEKVKKLQETTMTAEKLSEMVDQIGARIMPLMEQIGPNAVRRHESKVAELKRIVVARAGEINRMLASPDKQTSPQQAQFGFDIAIVPQRNLPPNRGQNLGAPKQIKFNANGIASLSDWTPRTDGQSRLETIVEKDKKFLLIRAENGMCNASFRTTVQLEPGRYTFEGRCKLTGVVALQGQDAGAGLRISGGHRNDKLEGNLPMQSTSYDFQVADPAREIVLVCELKASKGEVLFEVDSLKLRRKP